MYAHYTAINGWLTRGGFRRDAAVLFTSSALARGMFFLATPFLARAFTPAHIGDWRLFVSAATVLGAIVCWRYEVAIPLPKEDEKARDLIGICALLAMGMSALIAVFLILFRNQFVGLIESSALRPFVWYIPAFTLLFGCEQASTFWLTRTGNFTSLGAARLVKATLTVLVPLSIATFFEADIGDLVAGTMLGQLAATAYLLRKDRFAYNIWNLGRERWKHFRQVMVEYRNYPMFVAPYAFVGQFSRYLVYFLIAAFATSSTVGFFAMAMQITYIPVTLITSALNQAFYKKAISHSDVRTLETLVLKVLRLQVFFAVPFFVILALNSPYILRFVLGDGWEEASGYVSWLAAPSMMLFFTAWLDRLFDKLGRQRLAVVLQLTYDAISIGLLFTLLATGHSPLFAVASYCLVTAGYNLIWLTITFRTAQFSLTGLSRLILFAGVLVFVVAGVHWISQRFLNQPAALSVELAIVVLIQLGTFRHLKGLEA